MPHQFTAFVGMFVPFAFWNIIFTFGVHSPIGLGIFSLVLLIVALFTIDKLGSYWDIKGYTKILLNLIVLFILTVITDFSIWGHWNSLNIFLTGKP